MRAIIVPMVLLLLCALAHADLYHVRVRTPAPELAGMVGVQDVGDDARLFLVDATDEADLAAQLNDAVAAARRRSATFDAASVVVARVQATSIAPVAAATAASWGLDRIDQRALPLDNNYSPLSSGAGATAWIVDTGIRTTHAEFTGGRATNDFSMWSSADDCHGHGTFVASTVGGATFGVATGVRLRGIRVLDCSGSGSTYGVAQGLAYILAHLSGRDVINLSLGYGARDAVVESVIADLLAAGVTVVAAAGNDNTNACNHFPSAQAGVMSVAASSSSDARASFSNYGSCVSLFAPGVSTRGAALGGGSTTMSGTSMAAPHVAGVAALLLPATDAPGTVASTIVSTATASVVTSVAGSPNLLVYTPSAITPSPSRSATPSRAAASASRTPTSSRTPSKSATSSPGAPRSPTPSRTPSKTPSRSRGSSRSPSPSRRVGQNAASATAAICASLIAVMALVLF